MVENKVAVSAGVSKKDAETDDVVRIPTYAENKLGAHKAFADGRMVQKKHAEQVAMKKSEEREARRVEAEKEEKKK